MRVGAMIIVRIAAGISAHFPARKSEWALAALLVDWGLRVAGPEPMFNTPATAQMTALASEQTWGYTAVTVGAIRLLALIINGTFYETRYGKISPHVRGVTAFLSCGVWFLIYIGLRSSGINSTGLAAYFWILVLDVINMWTASHDAGRIDRARKNGDA